MRGFIRHYLASCSKKINNGRMQRRDHACSFTIFCEKGSAMRKKSSFENKPASRNKSGVIRIVRKVLLQTAEEIVSVFCVVLRLFLSGSMEESRPGRPEFILFRCLEL
jgi:hypothetical protein